MYSPGKAQPGSYRAPVFAFFLSAHRAFILADNFFRMAGVIGLRFEAAFLDVVLPFCFARHTFFAAPILAKRLDYSGRRGPLQPK